MVAVAGGALSGHLALQSDGKVVQMLHDAREPSQTSLKWLLWTHRKIARWACRHRKRLTPSAFPSARSGAGRTWVTWSPTERQADSAGSASNRSSSSWKRSSAARVDPPTASDSLAREAGLDAQAADSRRLRRRRHLGGPRALARAGFLDSALHVQLGVEVRRIGMPVLDPLAAQ